MADETDYQALLERMVEEAVQWREEHLDPAQELATEYYKGRPFGNEEEGRSQVVMTEVRDVVMAKKPSLMRIFFGPENVVEFRPRKAEDIPVANQQTEYVNYIVKEDNDGFVTFLSAFDDALIRKLGIIKWWWEDTTRVEESEHTGLTEMELSVLLQDQDVEVLDLVDLGGSFHVKLRRSHSDGRPRIEAVPPEEFVFSPNARSLAEARMVAHVREVPADELLAMGIPEELVEEARQHVKERVQGTLEASRRIDGGTGWEEDEQDEATLPVRYAEVYAKCDIDGDGISELRLFQCVGPKCLIANGDGEGEVVDERPFALFCPIPEAHTLVGMSDADLVMDLQKIKSAIARGVMDSLNLTLNPMTEVVEGMVNMQDVMNPEVGKIVRVRQPGMMREVTHRFVGADALAVIAYLDDTRESRTGTTKASAGLDADVLQSTTKAAVEMTREGSRQQLELTARIFAETGMKQLFRGLLRLVVRHQSQPRVVRLRNEWVPVDPRHWDANMDVSVNVALGSGGVEEKIQALGMILEKQELLLQTGVPLVTLTEYRNTLGRVIELLGFKNSAEFFRPWGEQEAQAFAQAQASQPQQPDPNMALVQVEAEKNQMKAQIDLMKLQIDQLRVMLEDDRQRDKIASDAVLQERKIEAEHAVDIKDAELRAQVAQSRASQGDG